MQKQSAGRKELAATLEKTLNKMLEEGQFMLNRDILYSEHKGVCLLAIGDRPPKSEILKMAHNSIMAGHLNAESTNDKVQNTSW